MSLDFAFNWEMKVRGEIQCLWNQRCRNMMAADKTIWAFITPKQKRRQIVSMSCPIDRWLLSLLRIKPIRFISRWMQWFSGGQALLQSQTMTRPPPCLTVGVRLFSWVAVFSCIWVAKHVLRSGAQIRFTSLQRA